MEGSIGNTLNWTVLDLSNGTYTIDIDGQQVLGSTSWVSNESISFNIDGLSVGIHTVTIYIIDDFSNTNSDSVLVTVKDYKFPTVTSPLDITYEEGSKGHFITWTADDTNPGVYFVEIDSYIVIENENWTSEVPIIVNLIDLTFGFHNVTILIYDLGYNLISDTVIIEVMDSVPPTINHPEDIGINSIYNQYIKWTP